MYKSMNINIYIYISICKYDAHLNMHHFHDFISQSTIYFGNKSHPTFLYMIWLGGTPAKHRMQISLIKGGKVGYTPIKLTCQGKIIFSNRRSINMNNELKINDSYNP